MDALLAQNMTPVLGLSLGLAIGVVHAFEPDHMAAVSTMVSGKGAGTSRSRIWKSVTKSSMLGAVWGAGHATTLVAFGLVAYLAAALIQDWIFAGLEFVVGAMLVALGTLAILNKGFLHEHYHTHRDGTRHVHQHKHPDGAHMHTHRSYVIGLVHGLAGSGALVALASTTFSSIHMVAVFMMVFAAGAAAGMCLVGSVLGASLNLAGDGVRRLFKYAAGAISIILGLIIMYQIILPS